VLARPTPQSTFCPQVAEAELVGVPPPQEGNPRLSSHEAVSPVATDEISRANVLFATVGMPEQTFDGAIAWFKTYQFDASFDDDARLRQVLREDPLGFGLGDEEEERGSRIVYPDLAELHRGNRRGREVNRPPGAGPSARDRCIGETEAVEDLESTSLHHQRA